jgi:hypothetical protein
MKFHGKRSPAASGAQQPKDEQKAELIAYLPAYYS